MATGTLRVLVLGGGLAGIAAACELLKRGHRVELFEQRNFLGGKVFSFRDRLTDQDVDNGQHVFLHCCTALRELLSEIGASAKSFLQETTDIPFFEAGHGFSSLRAVCLPAPFHLLPSLALFRPIGLREKWRLGWALASLLSESPSSLEPVLFSDWLLGHGQSRSVIERFWNVIVLAALNAPVDRVSASMAAKVFRDGLLANADAGRVGYARSGLSTMVNQCAVEFLQSRRAAISMGKRLERLEAFDGRIARAIFSDRSTAEADAYILALPHRRVLDVLPEEVVERPYFARLRKLETAPILGVHLWYDRDFLNKDFTAVVGSPIHWAFNKSRIFQNGQSRSNGQGYVTLIVSGAHGWLAEDQAAIVSFFDAELRRLFPEARKTALVRGIVVKEREATFVPGPGSERLRPAQRTPLGNLFLAGAWTATGWPATMEGAVRSGRLAVQALETACRQGLFVREPLDALRNG